MTNLAKAKRPEKPGELLPRPDSNRTTITFELKVVTFLQGGGVIPKLLDERTLIRGSAIRGHLRFWWRATHGCTFKDIAEMREHEGALWGAAAEPQKRKEEPKRAATVALRVEKHTITTKQRTLDKRADKEICYGAIDVVNVFEVHGSAKITLSFPADRTAEVLNALQAWRLFGGLGGRTRRGYGTIEIDKCAELKLEEPEVFVERISKLARVGQQLFSLLPTLHGANLKLGAAVEKSDSPARVAWKLAIGRLQDFRQGKGVGRNYDGPSPKRSFWPEPDSIRFLTKSKHNLHRPEHDVRERFPRARFGLPIVFQFKGKKEGDPANTILEPANYQRMASPLIVKAVATKDGYRPLALVLNVPGAADVRLVLKISEREQPEVRASLTDAEAEKFSPMRGRGADPLQAFLNFFSQGTS